MIIHQGTQPLRTPRLILRRFELADAQAMFLGWASNPEASKYMLWKTHQSIDDTITIINQWLHDYQQDNYYRWAIVLKDTQKPIGFIGLSEKKLGLMELFYCISQDYWGKNITAEAAIKILEFMFETIKINKVFAEHHEDNQASGRVLTKIGMVFGEIKNEPSQKDPSICNNNWYYSINSKQWQQLNEGKQAHVPKQLL